MAEREEYVRGIYWTVSRYDWDSEQWHKMADFPSMREAETHLRERVGDGAVGVCGAIMPSEIGRLQSSGLAKLAPEERFALGLRKSDLMPVASNIIKMAQDAYAKRGMRPFLFKLGQWVRLKKGRSDDGQTPAFWDGATVTVTGMYSTGAYERHWYHVRHGNGNQATFVEHEFDYSN